MGSLKQRMIQKLAHKIKVKKESKNGNNESLIDIPIAV